MQYVFGPVPSRRLGRSLGIDTVPFKTCSYDCVYCQLGRTTTRTITRKEYVPVQDIMAEVETVLERQQPLDYITFSGSGEPTLHSRIGEMLAAIKARTTIPVAVLTNGSLLWDPEVRAALSGADLVIPSLDAAREEIFRAVNRPCEGLGFDQVVTGLQEFVAGFNGQVWVEVMLVKGMNDQEDELHRLAERLESLKANKIQLNTVVRPPAEPCALPVDPEGIREAFSALAGRCEVIDTISHRDILQKDLQEVGQEMVELIRRRPCTVNDIAAALNFHPNEVLKYLKKLVDKGIVEVFHHGNSVYYRGRD